MRRIDPPRQCTEELQRLHLEEADKLRRQAASEEDWAMSEALVQSAAELERRAGQPRMRVVVSDQYQAPMRPPGTR